MKQYFPKIANFVKGLLGRISKFGLTVDRRSKGFSEKVESITKKLEHKLTIKVTLSKDTSKTISYLGFILVFEICLSLAMISIATIHYGYTPKINIDYPYTLLFISFLTVCISTIRLK